MVIEYRPQTWAELRYSEADISFGHGQRVSLARVGSEYRPGSEVKPRAACIGGRVLADKHGQQVSTAEQGQQVSEASRQQARKAFIGIELWPKKYRQ